MVTNNFKRFFFSKKDLVIINFEVKRILFFHLMSYFFLLTSLRNMVVFLQIGKRHSQLCLLSIFLASDCKILLLFRQNIRMWQKLSKKIYWHLRQSLVLKYFPRLKVATALETRVNDSVLQLPLRQKMLCFL